MPDDPLPHRFRPLLAGIVERIVAADYAGLTRDYTLYADDPAYDLGLWARDYPATFVPLPEQAWQHADVYRSDAGPWHVELPLWSQEEGRSDLTLEVEIVETAAAPPKITIRNLHVP
ncbi:MAG: DUF7668 domain-containing protein [Micromonosporaceae bacterium]